MKPPRADDAILLAVSCASQASTIYGNPSHAVDQLAQLREDIGLDYIMCSPLSHKSFMLFTEHVLPKLG